MIPWWGCLLIALGCTGGALAGWLLAGWWNSLKDRWM